MVWVRPGVLLVLAILLPTSELIRLDLPTLERPTKAISGAPGGRELPRIGSRSHEARQNLHTSNIAGAKRKRKWEMRGAESDWR